MGYTVHIEVEVPGVGILYSIPILHKALVGGKVC